MRRWLIKGPRDWGGFLCDLYPASASS